MLYIICNYLMIDLSFIKYCFFVLNQVTVFFKITMNISATLFLPVGIGQSNILIHPYPMYYVCHMETGVTHA